jgi:hypothetical protein
MLMTEYGLKMKVGQVFGFIEETSDYGTEKYINLPYTLPHELHQQTNKQINSVALSPRANYTD